jgi:aspartyl-tRNA(Asn)/glutamyl-tRNA(Gln) amidotransferase subunit C
MSLTPDDIGRIARLARIKLSGDDADRTLASMNGIFALIEQLKATDTAGIEPMSHAVEVTQRLRHDQVTESDCRAAMQAVAPETEAGLYLVPKVIE